MDKVLAKRLVANTLENPFKKEDFVRLSKEICKKYDESKAFAYYGTYVAEIFRQYVKGYERIATYTDPEDKKIDVLIVYLQKDSSLERARTAQRNFIARYLKDRDEKDAAIVAFVSPDVSDWRFSFVKMEYRLEKTEKGLLKAKEEFTPARRYSFLVGATENSHTAQTRLLSLLLDDKQPPLLGEIEDAFSIEKVTDEFFEKYRNLFLEVQDALAAIVSKNTKLKTEFELKHVDLADFAKKLLGQIVFLYFLQKKGWFGVERDSDWGTGPKDFLRRLFSKQISTYDNFFNDILEPLFYEALACERACDFYSKFNCKIPFLNGGLFDPINNYDWVHTDIALPSQLFSNSHKTIEGDIGTGILDVFDRYNFTVKEDEPLDKEVAIDPEMLGKVFENLLEVKDRKSKGTYYTPREIVHYMCQQSLICYLTQELAGKVSKADLETYIEYGETTVEHDARVEEKGRETKDYSYKLPSTIRDNAELIDARLADIKVCDPAVGSGAFLVGMMSEIVRARKILTAYFKDKSARTVYEFKRIAIHDALYGVDIDPSAVEIAKLRLWLSLIVDEDDIKYVKPLPNLDYKIMQGNSLFEEYEGVKLFDEKFLASVESDREQLDALNARAYKLQQEYFRLHALNTLSPFKQEELESELRQIKKAITKIDSEKQPVEGLMLFDEMNLARRKVEELQKLHLEFFEVSQKRRKDDIRKQIENLEWDLIESTLKEENRVPELKKLIHYKKANIKPFFLWKLHFSEVFRKKKGFDVVIANPPYVRQEEITHIKATLQSCYSSYDGRADLFVYFYERGSALLKELGVLTFISSNKWLRAKYGSPLRGYIGKHCPPQIIIDFGELPIFSAATFPMIFMGQKGFGSDCQFARVTSLEAPYPNITQVLKDYNQKIDASGFGPDSWSFSGQGDAKVIEKMRLAQGRIEPGLIMAGIKTGFNKAFWLNEKEKASLISNERGCQKFIKPLLLGDDIRAWHTKPISTWIIYTPIGTNPDLLGPLKAHLHKWKDRLKERALSQEWYELQQAQQRYCKLFESSKIVYPDIAKESRFTFDEQGRYLDMTAFAIASADKSLLAILNSKAVWFFLKQTAAVLGDANKGGRLRLKRQYLEKIPIPHIPQAERAILESLATKILNINADKPGSDTSALDSEINRVVYGLYKLTIEEIAVVEDSVKSHDHLALK